MMLRREMPRGRRSRCTHSKNDSWSRSRTMASRDSRRLPRSLTASVRSTDARTEIDIAPRGDPVRVVVAEDTLFTREGIVHLLRDAGIDVVAEAENAEQLLTHVRRSRPDAAVIDIRMPPTHTDEGSSPRQQIRTDYPEVGVLLLSQYVDPRTRCACSRSIPSGSATSSRTASSTSRSSSTRSAGSATVRRSSTHDRLPPLRPPPQRRPARRPQRARKGSARGLGRRPLEQGGPTGSSSQGDGRSARKADLPQAPSTRRPGLAPTRPRRAHLPPNGDLRALSRRGPTLIAGLRDQPCWDRTSDLGICPPS